MLRINPIFKAASRILNQPGYLDPHRHITMSHNPHNVYVQLYEIGQYPEVVEIMSQPPRTYEPIVVKSLVETINTHFPGSNLTEQFLQKNSHRTINQLLTRLTHNTELNFENALPTLLITLAQNIIVRESKFTWIIEQKFRYQMSKEVFSSYNTSEKTVKDFLDEYNNCIDVGHSKQVIQPLSPLERHYFEELKNTNDGIPELLEDRPENKTFINKLMAALHF